MIGCYHSNTNTEIMVIASVVENLMVYVYQK